MPLEGVTCGCSGCPCTPAEPAAAHRSQPVQLSAPWSGSLGRPVQEKRVNKGLNWGIPQTSRGSDGASPLPGRLPAVLHAGSLWLAAGRGTWEGGWGVTSDLVLSLLWDAGGGPRGVGEPQRGSHSPHRGHCRMRCSGVSVYGSLSCPCPRWGG